eukprot:scaffold19_cov114-Cylindrotheca_fusiformis.AAC.26
MKEHKKLYALLLCLPFAQVQSFSSHNHYNKNKRIRRNIAEWKSTGTSPTSLEMVSRSMTSPSSKTRDIEKQIVRLGRSGKTDEALSLYFKIKCPSTRLVNCAIDACSRARPTRLKQAFTIIDRAVEEKGLRPNVFTFGALMSVCNRARDSDKALALLRSFEETHRVAPNAVVYSTAISACARSQPPKPKQALQLLQEAVEEKGLEMSVVGFNAAIFACAQAADWEGAIHLMERMEGASNNSSSSFRIPAPDLVTYGTVLAACERGEQWSLVLKYATAMRDRGLEMDGIAITSCLHACQQLGLADEALFYLNKMKTAPPATPQTAKLQRYGARVPLQGPDPVAYRLAISACARGGAWREGVRLLADYRNVTGEEADVVAYTSAITGCEYAGKWKEAFYVLDKMRKNGVEPNEVTMAAVLGACATSCASDGVVRANKSERPEEQIKALQFLELMKKDPTMVKPNIQVYNAAIRVCAEACDLKRAFKLLEEIEEAGIERTEVTYGTLMTACERVGCLESVSQVFRKMREDEISPNEIIYGAAISCCRKSKQSERALLLLRKMMKEGLSPNTATFNTVLMAQAETRTKADIERAVVVYKLMKSKFATPDGRPNRQTYTILVNFFATIRQPIMAEAFLKKMNEDGLKPDVDLFTATVAAYERSGQPLRAIKLMESMQADGYDFYSVKVLNSAFSKAVRLVNKVGQSLSPSDASQEEKSLKNLELDENDDELL